MRIRHVALAALSIVASLSSCRAPAVLTVPDACTGIAVETRRVEIPRDEQLHDVALSPGGAWLLHAEYSRDDRFRVTRLDRDGRPTLTRRARALVGGDARYEYRIASHGETLGLLAINELRREVILATLSADGELAASPAVRVPPTGDDALEFVEQLALEVDHRGHFVVFDLLGFARFEGTTPVASAAFEHAPRYTAGTSPRRWSTTLSTDGFVLASTNAREAPRAISARWIDEAGRTRALAVVDAGPAAAHAHNLSARAAGDAVMITYRTYEGLHFAVVGAPGELLTPPTPIRWDPQPPRSRLDDVRLEARDAGGFWLSGIHPYESGQPRRVARTGLFWITESGLVTASTIVRRRPDSGLTSFTRVDGVYRGVSRGPRARTLRSRRPKFHAVWVSARCSARAGSPR